MDLEKKLTGKITLLVVVAILLYMWFNYWHGIMGVLGSVYGLLFPFILGGCIAFILNIPVTFFSNNLSRIKVKGIRRVIGKFNTMISIALSCVLIIGVLVLVSYIIIPNIIDTIKVLPQAFDNSTTMLQSWINSKSWLSTNIMNLINNLGINWDSIINSAKNTVFNWASSVLLSTLGVATGFASAIVEFVLAFMFSIYILTQKKKLGVQFKKIIFAFLPQGKADSILEVITLTAQTFSNFITGQCIESAILGFMFFVTLIILKFPYALVISILIGFTAVIPVLGSFIGFAVATFLIVMVDPMKAGIFIIVFLVLKQIEDNIIYPKIVGNSVGLPSIWVLVAITVGGKTLGVAGMIIFIPLFSVAYVLFRREVYSRLKKKKLEIK
ncbi:AI-2E family transporter [Clostridium manihotivorum]|uniref:AI-2E family transporter n=1 Tax=Clostridium manihotivorum TaxID=2320868 RepID=A0A3R5R0B9_9CLOT|nr:AI-2E family transporter [Clostridium manihotivorum]QAA33694.1 AI-2E family transporter [Clostridium manihotivorum]